MRWLLGLLLIVSMNSALAPQAMAQADARAAYDAGKAAYQAADYAKARDQFLAASQTDLGNPEVFLWLGKAHYELGSLDEAIAAWTTTLKLAPNEPYAGKMLAALRGDLGKIDNVSTLIDILLREQLYEPTLHHAQKTLADKGLTDAQQARTMMQKAHALIGLNQANLVPAIVQEILVKYPKLADASQTTVLLGQAYLRMKGDKTEAGLTLLRKVLAEHAGTPAAVVADFDIIGFDLEQGTTPTRIDALAKWVAANGQHALAAAARIRLVEAYLSAASQAGSPRPDAPLAREDTVSLQAAADVYKQIVSAIEAERLTRRIIAHLDERYVKSRAFSAAVSAGDLLLKANLPRSSRVLALRASARYRTELAMQQLAVSIAATGGTGLKNDPLPQALVDMLNAINQEFPSEPIWKEQAALAERVRQLAPPIAWPAKITEPKAPLAWAVQIALPVIKANTDDAAIAEAANTIGAVVKEIGAIKDPQARVLAAAINEQLLAALSTDRPAWAGAAWQQVDLLDAIAQDQFQENVKAARLEENAKLSATQQQLLAALAKIVSVQASSGQKALDRLTAHVQGWIAAEQYKVAEDAYTQLGKSLPAAQPRAARLAIAGLWVQQVMKDHQRLTMAGLTPPRQLDPNLSKALKELCALQADVPETDPFIVEVRNLWNRILAHYRQLEYYDIAEQAIAVKADADVAAARAHAQLQLARLRREQAQRELGALLKQYEPQRKITLTPAWQAAIDAYQKFITDFPANPFVDQAADEILDIAGVFEHHQAYDVAADVYRSFAAFAGKQKALAQSTPTAASMAERAAFAVAGALDAKARVALAKALADRKPGAPPPPKVSDEFAAAIASYKEFIKARPNSLLLGPAIQRIMAVALEYARTDAWDVADGIYADLLAAGLALRSPERIEFSRAVCQLGKAMPDHAKDVLNAAVSRAVSRGAAFGGLPATQPADGAIGLVVADGRVLVPVDLKPAKPAFRGAPVSLPQGALFAESKDASQQADMSAIAAITQEESRRAAQVASLRESTLTMLVNQPAQRQQAGNEAPPRAPVLSDAELTRLDAVLDTAYKAFKAIRDKYPTTATADESRGEMLVMIAYWRSVRQWQRSGALAQRFLADNPTDAQLAQIRMEIARDYLTFAAQPLTRTDSRQAMLAEVANRFEAARVEFGRIPADFPERRDLSQQARWEIATSFLTQARAIASFSPTLARGQYVRAARQLQKIAIDSPEHPNLAAIPQAMSQIAAELASRSFFEEALIVWNDLINFDPTNPLAVQAAPQIAAIYQNNLNRPLRAVETYLEINFARGGTDAAAQNAVFQIGSQLKDQKRWIEAMSVLETFVNSFPRHPSAGQALTTIGQIHQANESWAQAIAAYRRVINEFPSGNWIQEAKWSIAECTINLSQWRQASEAYEAYVQAYPKDGKVAEATRRISVLKDLARYQTLVDEPGQRKAFDAQFQIGTIVQTQLANPTKAVIEFRKVATNWPECHLADDALFAVGTIYLSMGETAKGREALLTVATKYPDSPMADDALYHVGKSYEDESQRLAGLTRVVTEQIAQETAQKEAYQFVQQQRDVNRKLNTGRIESLKKGGKSDLAELEEARQAGNEFAWNTANFDVALSNAAQVAQSLSAAQLADRQDKINASLRKAVENYATAAKVPGGDKAGDALLRMAVIYDEQLKDSQAALATWQEIVRQFSGTAVAEEASWRIAQYYERAVKWTEAVEAYKAFLRNYRGSPKAAQAQFSIAEGCEHLNKWVEAMDAYSNFINNFADNPLAQKAKEQINWIKTYRL